MANIQTQQARVLLLDGQTIILQNDSTENSFNEINPDLLQQALQNVAAVDNGEDAQVENYDESSISENGNNFRVIFQNSDLSQAIRISAEEAEALGLHIFVDDDDKQVAQSVGNQDIGMVCENPQMAFSEVSLKEESQNIFQNCVKTDEVCDGIVSPNPEQIDALSSAVTAFMTDGANQPITLIPQFLDGQVTYAVKFPEDESTNSSAPSHFPELEEDKVPLQLQEPTVVLNSTPVINAERVAASVFPISQNEFCSRTSGVPLQPRKIVPDINIVNQAGKKIIPVTPTSLKTGRPVAPIAPLTAKQFVATTALRQSGLTVRVGGKMIDPSKQVPPKIIVTTTTTTTPAPPSVITTTASTTSTTSTTATTVPSVVSAALTRMPVANMDSSKPLGSSENPIQLVQHGQTFHSVQALSQEQLKQIATVLQQQHLESAPRTKNVLYDAETNTRIIYRVVYPEDLDLRDPKSPLEGRAMNQQLQQASVLNINRMGRGGGRRGRPPKNNRCNIGGSSGSVSSGSNINMGFGRGNDLTIVQKMNVASPSTPNEGTEADDDKLDDVAKGERKKQVARTRSGRLSRPPRHMVKDYKRLHHLDFAEPDLDDSDGGYSDYQMSDHDGDDPSRLQNDSKSLLPGLVQSKRKISSRFRCPTCQKIYLGHSRLSRHFQMFPDHGNMEQLEIPHKENTILNGSQMVSDETKREETVSIDGENNSPDLVGKPVMPLLVNGSMLRPGNRRKGKRRGPWAYITPEVRSQRRKLKLKEAITSCEAAELVEVAGPALASVMSLWEFLCLRLDALLLQGEAIRVQTLLQEFSTLLEKVRTLMKETLVGPVDQENADSMSENYLELYDDQLCMTLGMSHGHYHLDEDKLKKHHGVPKPEKSEDRVGVIPTSEADENPPMKKIKEVEVNCPDVLPALESLEPKVQRTDTTPEEHFLEVMCDDQAKKALQAVDDIVNERLKNLTTGLVDFLDADIGLVALPVSGEERGGGVTGRDFTSEISSLERPFNPSVTGPTFEAEGTSFDEALVAAIGDSEPGGSTGSEVRRQTFQLDLADSADLDFEALSEEFNRNTRHS